MHHPTRPHRPALVTTALLAAGLLSACAALDRVPEGPPRKDSVVAVTASNQLLRFNAGQPGRILSRTPLTGLQAGETVLDIDYRIVKGQLYALGSSGRLYRVNADSGVASVVGAPIPVLLSNGRVGIDFNPTVDRLRVVAASGLNLRLHPDTGAMVDGNATLEGAQTDSALNYAAGDANAGKAATVVAAAYSYNKDDEKITTNYAIDAALGLLVMQGSLEGTKPVVSPNTGQLRTIGALGAGGFKEASFDIADVSGAAYAALGSGNGAASRWVEIDLKTGAAKPLGAIGGGEPVRGIAIEP